MTKTKITARNPKIENQRNKNKVRKQNATKMQTKCNQNSSNEHRKTKYQPFPLLLSLHDCHHHCLCDHSLCQTFLIRQVIMMMISSLLMVQNQHLISKHTKLKTKTNARRQVCKQHTLSVILWISFLHFSCFLFIDLTELVSDYFLVY